MESEICQKRWRWIGHILRKQIGNTTDSLRWTPEGKGKHHVQSKGDDRGAIKGSSRAMGYRWKEAKKVAKKRGEWKGFVKAFCD